MNAIHQHRFHNGLILLVEPMTGVESVGMTLLSPAGSAVEPADRLGCGAVLSEWLLRGAGDLDARAHCEAMDQLGIQRGLGTQTHHLRLGATFLRDRMDAALPLLIDIIRRPMLNDAAFNPSRDLAVQAIDALEDEPQDKTTIELKRRHFPQPLGRSGMGERDHLLKMTPDEPRKFFRNSFVPDGAILSFAGKVDFSRLRDRIGGLLGDWSGAGPKLVVEPKTPRGAHHVAAPSTQQHIALATDAVPEAHDDSIVQRVGIAALSGGMSGRLFTEVREKRGLCYAVHAGYHSIGDRGAIFAYAGTTVERADETLKVLQHELRRLSEGVEKDEFDRAIVGLKARVVMQGESTAARASAIANDQFLLGRPRTLEELAARIDSVTPDRLNDFLAAHPMKDFTLVNVGPKPLKQD